MKKQNNISQTLLVLSMLLCSTTPTQAELFTIGTANYGGSAYNLIYDADSPSGPIVWLDLTIYERLRGSYMLGYPNGFTASISLNPGVTTATDLSAGWRLPVAGSNPQNGFYQTGNELGHLFYTELGNSPTYGYLQNAWVNKGPFEHLGPNPVWCSYWTSTPYPGLEAYWSMSYNGSFSDLGSHSGWYDYNDGNALFVHNAIVTISVPEPPPMSIAGIALALWLYTRMGRNYQNVQRSSY